MNRAAGMPAFTNSPPLVLRLRRSLAGDCKVPPSTLRIPNFTDMRGLSDVIKLAVGQSSMADQEVNDVPRPDPEAAREIAVKHLFRHLRADRQLLQNPLVGPDLLGGTFTA